MPFYTLSFENPTIEFNVSLQIGDTVYWCPSVNLGGFPTANMNNVAKIGELRVINITGVPLSNLVCWSDTTLAFLPGLDDFIMFSKENEANLSSLLGYVAEVKFVNTTRNKAELFSIGAEVSESSK